MLTAVEQTALWTVGKIKAIKLLMDETVRHVSKTMPSLYSRELVEIVFTQPYCRIGNLVDTGIGNRNTAAKYLRELAAGGVLESRKEGREQLYINARFLELLTQDDNEFRTFAA
jgi:Fic family protein